MLKLLKMDIRQTRRLLNLSQRELADKCGLSIGTILRAEKTGQITVKNYRLITQILNDVANNTNRSLANDGTPHAPIF